MLGTDLDGAPSLGLARFADSGEALPGASLYEALGRPDLAERYRSRQRARIALLATGITVASVGALVTLPFAITGAVDQDSDTGRRFALGGGIALGATVGIGVTLAIAGGLTRSRPISERATRRLIDRFNASQGDALDGGSVASSSTPSSL